VEVATNHLIDIYRATTQDPFVRRVDFELDIFVVAFSFGSVPAPLVGRPPEEILRNVQQVQFSGDLKDHRFHYRINTWEDLFPGPVLDQEFVQVIAALLPSRYELPLHYDLVFTAQAALKARSYHVAVLELRQPSKSLWRVGSSSWRLPQVLWKRTSRGAWRIQEISVF
jgi:hypothetical protein